MTLAELTADFQKRVIEHALETHAGNHRKAAEELGLSRIKLSRLKRRYGIPLRPTQAWRFARGCAPSLNGLSPEAAIRRGRG